MSSFCWHTFNLVRNNETITMVSFAVAHNGNALRRTAAATGILFLVAVASLLTAQSSLSSGRQNGGRRLFEDNTSPSRVLFGRRTLKVEEYNPGSPLYNAKKYVRHLCRELWPSDTNPDAETWEELFEPSTVYVEDENVQIPDTSQIAYVLPLLHCPEATEASSPVFYHGRDPEHAFRDAAAMMKHATCRQNNNYPGGGNYNSTMFALVHPKAVMCQRRDGEMYDRVKVLQSLGYWVLIWEEPVYGHEITNDELKSDIHSNMCLYDLMKIHAFRLTEHPLVVVLDWNSFLMKPLDPVFDYLLGETTEKPQTYMDNPVPTDSQVFFVNEFFNVLPEDGKNVPMNMGLFVLKPSLETYNQLTWIVKHGTYTAKGGFGDVGFHFSGKMCVEGLLKYYFTTFPSGQLDRCVYGNQAVDPWVSVDGTMQCRDIHDYDCSNDCRQTPPSDIVLASMTSCGAPWECPYDPNPDTILCREFHHSWATMRKEYEAMGGFPQANVTGDFHPDIFLGMCASEGRDGYITMPDPTTAHMLMTEAEAQENLLSESRALYDAVAADPRSSEELISLADSVGLGNIMEAAVDVSLAYGQYDAAAVEESNAVVEESIN